MQILAKRLQENAKIYIEKVRKLANKMQTELEVPNIGVIVFHDAFVYLAEYLGLSPRGYQDYETNQNDPKLKTLIAIADYYNVSIDYLVGRTDAPDFRAVRTEE